MTSLLQRVAYCVLALVFTISLLAYLGLLNASAQQERFVMYKCWQISSAGKLMCEFFKPKPERDVWKYMTQSACDMDASAHRRNLPSGVFILCKPLVKD